MIWKNKPDIEALNFFSKNTLNEALGIELIDIGDDFMSARMPVGKATVQPFRILHGGASACLIETLGSVASSCCADLSAERVVGVELNCSHLRSVEEGSAVVGTVRPVRIGRSMHVWQVEIEDEKGRLSCIGRLTVAIVPIRAI